jgi:phosphate transport system protein
MTHLQEELEQLRETLTDMAKLVTRQLKNCLVALAERDEDLANDVVFSEKRVNAYELQIDRDCEHIFTLLTPVASDMRFVFSTLKINADLERIGDYAEGIAKLVLMGLRDFDDALIGQLQIARMHEISSEMMTDITRAYCDDDSALARRVYTQDKLLNEINHHASGIITDYCAKNTGNIAQALYLLSIVRKLERVGDHITNIAEDVIFYKEAKVLKHRGIEDVDKLMD